MKSKIVATVLLTLSFTQLFSQADLVVFSEDGHRFWLVLNGIRQNQEAETNVKVTDLNGEWFKGKILFEDETLGQIDKNIGVQTGIEATYIIKRDKKGSLVLKFFSQAPLATAPPPPADVKVITYRTTAAPPPTQVRVTETRETIHMSTDVHDGTTGDNVDVDVNVNFGGVNFGMDVNINDGSGHVHTSEHIHTTEHVHTHQTDVVVYEEVVVEEGPCAYPMSQGDFANAKRSIASKDFSDSKMKVAKQITSANCIYADQVKQIMQLFDFEDDRLEFAKYAYDYTYDKNNYYVVNDAFEFELTIDELDEYIQRR